MTMRKHQIVPLVILSHFSSWLISGCHSMAVPRPTERHTTNGGHSGTSTASRRAFSASLVGIASAFLVRPKHDEANAAEWWNPFGTEEPWTYADFKGMVESGEILQVQFGVGGTSLVCVDTAGIARALADLPDDLTLLRELNNGNVDVTMQDIPPRAMSAWEGFKDAMGIEELTDEEKYKYRGYKTFRMNTHGEVPSSLLTNFK